MFWLMFYDRFLVSYGGFDWGKPGVFANDETFDLLDILAYTPFVFVERYYQFCLW